MVPLIYLGFTLLLEQGKKRDLMVSGTLKDAEFRRVGSSFQ